MSDDKTQSKVDLFEGNQQADASTAEAGANDDKVENLVTEQKTQTEKPVDKAAEQRQKQIDHWVNEIAAGNKSIDDLPADKAWLKPGINQGLGNLQKQPEIDEIVDRRIAEKEALNEFRAKQKIINAMSLTKEKRDILNEEFNENKSLGLADNVALTKAMKVAGISTNTEDQERSILRQRMALPHQGTQNTNGDVTPKPEDPDFHKKVTDPKEKMKILMQHMRSSG